MKRNIIILFITFAFFGSACEEFLSVNEVNPNNASKVEPKLLVPAAINDLSNIMNNPRSFDFAYLWHGLWSVSAGYSQPQNLVQYKLINSNYQGAFINFYTTANNFNTIEKVATDPKDAYFAAIAKIMKAYIFQNLVDCWGDVPYSEAFSAPSILKPKYDSQKAIYEDLVVQLDAAIKLIQDAGVGTNAVSPASDIMFGGNMTLWQKFANTLKLRILVHQSGMSSREAYIKAAIATTASVGYLGAGESALVNPGYLISDGKMNPFYGYFYNASGTSQPDGVTYYFAGLDAVDFYKATNDPRLGQFFSEAAAGGYDGNIFGTLSNDLTPANETSRLGYKTLADGKTEDPGTMIGTGQKSSPILTDFESLFIQAEAAQRGLITGDAKALYENAIARSFVYMGLPSGSESNYLSQQLATVSYTEATDKLELILTQKWASLNGIAPVEIWTDYRRTGIPTFLHFSVDPAKAGPGTPPVRLLYPQDEITVNNENVVKVGVINAFTSKIFWQNR